jgi:hypothetical protein
MAWTVGGGADIDLGDEDEVNDMMTLLNAAAHGIDLHEKRHARGAEGE